MPGGWAHGPATGRLSRGSFLRIYNGASSCSLETAKRYGSGVRNKSVASKRVVLADVPGPPNFQERKSSPKSKFWGRISGGRPRGYPGGRQGAKTSVKPSKSWKIKHFGADVHEPKARTSMTRGVFKKLRSEKLRAEFSFPKFGPYPQYGWDLPEEIPEEAPERPRKRSQSVSWDSPREYGWDTPNPIIQGI